MLQVAKRIGFPMKMWLRVQSFLFPVITTSLVALGWQFYLHPRYIQDTPYIHTEPIIVIVIIAMSQIHCSLEEVL